MIKKDYYWNEEDSNNIICPYCFKEYEPSYEETFIGGESVDCYDEDKKECTCDRCEKKFVLRVYRKWRYQTETIDGEMTEEEQEAWV